jgi:head-tail adaptor
VATRRGAFEPGLRDRVVTIESRSATDAVDTTSGEPTETWTTLVANMPAAKTDVSGWERFRMDQQSARADQRWEMNYRADMDPELVDVPKLRRLVVSGRTLEIVAASEIGRREGIELLTLAASGT